MNQSVRRRVIGLSAAAVMMWLGIAFLVGELQWQWKTLQAQLEKVDSESLRIGDTFREKVRQLNDSLYHYGRSDTPTDVAGFNKASQELSAWIHLQKSRSSTAEETALMTQIGEAYQNYQLAAKALLERLVLLHDKAASMDDYNGIRVASQQLFELGQKLTQVHLESRNQLLAKVESLTTALRALVLMALGLLCLFSLALAFLAYRDMIKPLRAQLIENQNLIERQEKMAALGLLAAGVAHEIRNPLTAMKAELFMQKKNYPTPASGRNHVEVVEREITRLEKIVSNFLQFARPAEPELVAMPVDLLLLESQQFFAPQLKAKNIQIVLEGSEPMRVSVDIGQFKQVLINLVQNAADSIGHDGLITLRASANRRRLGRADTDTVIIEISDTGKGIPPAVQKRLFDPFFTTKENGTGLGLSIAARIVQQHGGQLQYQTEVNRGTTFGIVLPRLLS